MKLTLGLFLSIFSFQAFSYVDSANCPETFTITYTDVSRVALNPAIENDLFAKMAWDRLKGLNRTLVYKFKISTRSDSALCVYTAADSAAYLQTNDGVDELVVGFDFTQGLLLYFQTKVLSFSSNHIEVETDVESRSLTSLVYPNPTSGEVVRTVPVAEAKSVSVKMPQVY